MPQTTEKTQKPRPKPAPYAHKEKKARVKDTPRTSSKPAAAGRHENLTLADWISVFKFKYSHPLLSQGDVVTHFKNKKDGALCFDQSTLSCKIKQCHELEGRVNSHPNALSSKQMQVVTRPDVEHALILWIHHMEAKGGTVSGPMLLEKCKRYEEILKVPDNECLPGDGWLAPFCKAYKIKEYC
ncbi:hypothetical protein CVT25_013486 [Psilocybe cyanescens]|uniref:HTH CENPB-type domain-containing protein n=1 Tax=Psilocybe cyanescens TaxID=93625 RepID=A0A409WTS7_PSICY|nr:hypothetical protein CVT25_013486 [Psilocybe cyanescens]